MARFRGKNFRWNDLGARRMVKNLRKLDMGSTSTMDAFGRMFRRWLQRYSTAVRRRFANEGNGEWPQLAESTVKARRRGSGAGTVKILRDTGMLFRALSIGAPGNVIEKIKGGVRFGIGGPTRHKDGDITLGDLAEIHGEGLGNVPQRTILIDPADDPMLRRGMMQDLGRAIEQSARL